MAVSSPRPSSLHLGASRWPKGDSQGGPSDNRPSDGTGCIDCGKLNSDPEDSYWLLQTERCRDQQVSCPQAEREAQVEEWVTHPGSQKEPEPSGGPQGRALCRSEWLLFIEYSHHMLSP